MSHEYINFFNVVCLIVNIIIILLKGYLLLKILRVKMNCVYFFFHIHYIKNKNDNK